MKKNILVFFILLFSIISLNSMYKPSTNNHTINFKKKFLSGAAKIVEGWSGYPFEVLRKFLTTEESDYALKLCGRELTFFLGTVNKLYKKKQDLSLMSRGINTIAKNILVSIYFKKEWYKQILKYSKVTLGLSASYYLYTNEIEHKTPYCSAALLFSLDAYFDNSIQKSTYFFLVPLFFRFL